MGLFDGFRAIIAAKQPAAAKIEDALGEAERLKASLEAQLESQRVAAESSRRELLLASPEERERSRQATAKLQFEIAEAGLYIEELQEQLATRRSAEAEERRREAYEAARELAAAAARALSKEYPAICKRYAVLAQQVLDADAAVARANGDLPESAEPLFGAEQQVRDRPSLPKRIIRETVVKLWVSAETGQVLPESIQDELKARSSPTQYRASSWTWSEQVERRSFRRVEYLPASRREAGPRLSDTTLPGLRFGDPPIAVKAQPFFANSARQADTFGELLQRRELSEPDRTTEPPQVEIVPLSPGVEIQEEGIAQ